MTAQQVRRVYIVFVVSWIVVLLLWVASIGAAQERPLPKPKAGDTPQCAELRNIQALMYRGMEDQGVIDMDEDVFVQYVEPGRQYLWDALNKVERLVKACDTLP